MSETQTTNLVVSEGVTQDDIQKQTAAMQRRGPFDAVFDRGEWTLIRDVCATIARSSMVPIDCRAKGPNDIDRAIDTIMCRIQFGRELGFGVMQALQNIADINGRPAVFGDAALALVYGSGLLEAYIEELSEDNTVATVKSKRRGIADPFVVRFTVDDAKRAGLWNKKGPWTDYPQRMLIMRARSWVLRNGFADVLKGIGIAEELRDIPTDERSLASPMRQQKAQPVIIHQRDEAKIRHYAGKISGAVTEAELQSIGLEVKGQRLSESERSELMVAYKNRADALRRDTAVSELRTIYNEVSNDPSETVESWYIRRYQQDIANATTAQIREALEAMVEEANRDVEMRAAQYQGEPQRPSRSEDGPMR